MIGHALVCHLCHKPVDIAKACTDDRGSVVHSHCYAKAIAEALTPNPPKTRKTA